MCINSGITPQELRFVIAEADENENGFIDYQEFVPLAVDMIQAFKARSRAKNQYAQFEAAIDDDVLGALSADELEKCTKICMQKFAEADSRHQGSLKMTDTRRCLRESAAGLTNIEVNLILQGLSRDATGKLLYSDFRKVLYEVRYSSMKNTMLEASGGEIQKHLMDLCKEEEKNFMTANGHDSTVTGWIPLRNLTEVMMRSSRLSLSRLQVMVIASEASVDNGKVNYWKFVPIAAKTIEMMFDPTALRKRAELIEKVEISPESLLKGLTEESVQKRLLTLFKSYDVDHSGDLSPKEFRACLESLEIVVR